MIDVRNTTASVPKTEFSPGEPVEVVLAGGAMAERLVWKVVGNLVYVCNLKTYERLQRGENAAMPIAFPLCDVRGLTLA